MARFETPAGAARLAGDDVLSGDGRAVVFLHAGVADRSGWRWVTNRLTGVRTVAYDRRGFGETTAEPERFSHAGDLVAVLDDRGIDRAVLVGNSQGGRIAIDTALAHPERVAALVLIAPAISGAPEEPIEALAPVVRALVAELEAADEAGDLEAVNAIEAHIWLDGPEQARGRVGGDARALFLAMNGRALAAADPGDAIEPPDAYERLGELAMPVLAMAGELDFDEITDHTRRVGERAPTGSFELLRGVAHLPQLEDPEGVARRIAAFVDSAE